MKKFLRYRLERLAVWALERCLTNQAWVLTREFKAMKDRADNFEKAVKDVEFTHRAAILKLEERLRQVEGR